MTTWHQNPSPGSHGIHYCGDALTITLFINPPQAGCAWLRTNLGRAHARRREIIDHVETQAPLLASDWHDVQMMPGNTPGVFELTMPLFETGRFEAKTFFMPEGEKTPIWPEGENLVIKVEPALSFCANSLYTAFVRQFGPNMKKRETLPLPSGTLEQLDERGYTFIPKSGTFRALQGQLDHIVNKLGFRIIQLLPIHPVPTTFARMGRFGSPFASIDFFDVDPALAEFDRKHTPLDQFSELADSIHRHGAMLFLDLPINHTGWASHLQVHHPEWFARNRDNSFASPGAWGITWEDLSELDYRHRELWHYMADVFLFWCSRGVDGFRCDAGYMVPLPVWQYIVAKVRESYPDTLFLLEGLGGKISVTRDLLAQANLNWAYSEFFQIYDRSHMENELQAFHQLSKTSGTLIHFAETHDNNRLAAQSETYARMRTTLAALCSEAGAFGITNGVEWFAESKVDVHGAPPLNWDNPVNQIDSLHQLNHLLRVHPAFHPATELHVIPSENDVIILLRTPHKGNPVLVLANLNTEHAAHACWPSSIFSTSDRTVFDLLTETGLQLCHREDGMTGFPMEPGQVLCLNKTPLPVLASTIPEALRFQRFKAVALTLYARLVAPVLPSNLSPASLAEELSLDPILFCERLGGTTALSHLTVWEWPTDLARTVMLPAGHMLLLYSPHPFRARLLSATSEALSTAVSLPCTARDAHFAFLVTNNKNGPDAMLRLQLSLHTPEGMLHQEAGVHQLSDGKDIQPRLDFDRRALNNSRRCALLTNGAGAMSQVRLQWGRIDSQYDCLLGANPDQSVPVDRQILFTRCRAWLVHKGYSYEIGIDCTRSVNVQPGQTIQWIFDVPAGLGKTVPLALQLRLCPLRNHVWLDIHRLPANQALDQLDNATPVSLILRPDIEDRNFHEPAKAYMGPEHRWPSAIAPFEDGFSFSSESHAPLIMTLAGACFTYEPEWLYGVPHPYEKDRGLDPDSDLFSPGFFARDFKGGDHGCLEAYMDEHPVPPAREAAMVAASRMTLADVLRPAIQDFVVRRDNSLTVIAGYPWFLDWGRDTLICLRGIIAAGMLDEAREILLQFARFEQNGTLPNMIRGNDDRNRDTSDAPLWFFTACADLLAATGDNGFLKADCGGRTLAEVLRSIALHVCKGTPNGIAMDPESALVFSPSHFTWMDTNHPAGTPREGYPIEIQALWHAALQMLSQFDEDTKWRSLAHRVREAITRLYRLDGVEYLSDCLHAKPGTPASKATADNALRPNQLFAITLGVINDPELMRGMLSATAKLLIPGAIRSLADQPVAPPLPVAGPHGLLNDPDHPYCGQYQGDEDTRRKPAYHNGTAWTWPFPSYCEALFMLDPAVLRATALSLMSSTRHLIETGCVGHLPEILDGNRPHRQRGCWAQAWGATEAYRVLRLLESSEKTSSDAAQAT